MYPTAETCIIKRRDVVSPLLHYKAILLRHYQMTWGGPAHNQSSKPLSNDVTWSRRYRTIESCCRVTINRRDASPYIFWNGLTWTSHYQRAVSNTVTWPRPLSQFWNNAERRDVISLLSYYWSIASHALHEAARPLYLVHTCWVIITKLKFFHWWHSLDGNLEQMY